MRNSLYFAYFNKNLRYIIIFLSAEFLQGHTPDRLRAKDPIRALENVVKSLCFMSTEWAIEFVVIFLFQVGFNLKHSKSSFD